MAENDASRANAIPWILVGILAIALAIVLAVLLTRNQQGSESVKPGIYLHVTGDWCSASGGQFFPTVNPAVDGTGMCTISGSS